MDSTRNRIERIDGLREIGSSRFPNVLATPVPDVDVLQFTPAGPVLCVRPYCRQADYWQVYFDTNRVIREAFGEAGYPAPAPSYVVSAPAEGVPPAALSN